MEQLSDALSRFVNLKKRGKEHVGICPFHDDKHESLKVNDEKNVWKCFACGESGKTAESFIMKMQGITYAEAKSITGDAPPPKEKPVKVTYTAIIPVPDDAPPAPTKGASYVWENRDERGRLESIVVRYDPPGQKKIIYPMTYCTDGVAASWQKQAPPKRYPYNRQQLAANKSVPVVITEGEKAMDAARRLLPDFIITTWHGGIDSIEHVDWTCLTGRNVILWPDNDEPGQVCMNGGWLMTKKEPRELKGLAAVLTELSCKVKVMRIHPQLPHKGDAADITLTPEQFRDWLTPEQLYMAKPIPKPETPAPPAPPPDTDEPFRVMGFVKSGDVPAYVFYSKSTKTLNIFKATALSVVNLMTLAPLNWWEGMYPAKQGKFDINAACNSLIQQANIKGIFNPSRIRGRGAWVDNNHIVIHAGKHLIVDGSVTPLNAFESQFVYEQARELHISTENPLTAKEARQVLTLLSQFHWERKVNGYLLAGWCVIAPICGVLSWRPHLWVTGAAGTGKTTVYRTIMRRLIGKCALSVQGDTTAAGLRQALQHDAVPVLFDEAEGDSFSDQMRMQAILVAIRGASSGDSGQVLKGSGTGSVMSYELQSMFAFSSITPQLKQQADRRRTTILSLVRDRSEDAAEKWKKLSAEIAHLITPEFCDRLQARTIRMIPVILRNIDTFRQAVTEHLGDINMGDQLAPILAGAFSLAYDVPVTIEQARDFVLKHDWNEEQALDESKDEMRLLQYIMETIIEVEDRHGKHNRSIQEICEDAANQDLDAIKRLYRIGVKVARDTSGHYLIIANSNTQMQRILKDTPWASNYSKILTRIPNAQKCTSERFGMVTSRAVKIPFFTSTNSEIELEDEPPF
jgi:putative DNA primase/helicase